MREILTIWNLRFRIMRIHTQTLRSLRQRRITIANYEVRSVRNLFVDIAVYLTREARIPRFKSRGFDPRSQIIFRNGFHLTFRSNGGIKKFRA